ncbi:MAG TPA: peptide-N4-asparagine amidase [Candidatus Angelobacter sp.]|nr:peptide-N4-asparagine amidase [Candidatus Angelobacter sp.]
MNVAWIAALVLFLASGVAAQSIPAPGLTIGSANTATADPPVTRPKTTPCTVPLFTAITFADFSPKPFSVTPPAQCPGPWAKVVLEADFSITAGLQFDRTANIWIGGTNVYFGTTSEPSGATGRSWHVERDLTDYSALFKSPQTGEVDLGNLVNSTFTSVLFGTADLQFFPLGDDDDRGPRTADVVLPLSAGPSGETVDLVTSTSALARTFVMPTNIERVFLDVLAQSQHNDEFWYTCVPNDVANELQSCGNTPFRETEVSIDGQPAGVAPVFPWIFTGGIDPLLWRPIPGVQTLNFVPYRVDLTPFAGALSNGQPHQISLSVFNANDHFSTTATLLLFLDHESTQVTGEVVSNSLAAPQPAIQENLSTDASGNITGTVGVTAARQFEIKGFVRTSHGRVETKVAQDIQFSNQQQFDITNTVFVQNITQSTEVSSQTTTRHRGEEETVLQTFSWPLTVDINFTVNPDNSSAFTTTISQAYKNRQATFRGNDDDRRPIAFSEVSNSVAPTDTQLLDATGALTGVKNRTSTQTYSSISSSSMDSRRNCFSRTITANNGLLASVVDGCKDHDGRDRDDKDSDRK